jgi:hypothetical protein
MLTPGMRSLSTVRILSLLSIGFLCPSLAWAHGESQPLQIPELDPFHPVAIFLLALLTACWCAGRGNWRRRRTSPTRRQAGHGLAWAVIGLFGIYLAFLPPHTVHHLASAGGQAQECTFFLLANSTDQGTIEAVIIGPGPAFAGEVPSLPTPSVPSHLAPPTCGRSPPELSV